MKRRLFLKMLGSGIGALVVPVSLVALSKPSKPIAFNTRYGLVELDELDHDVGYTGQVYADEGYFYCPYVPLMRSSLTS